MQKTHIHLQQNTSADGLEPKSAKPLSPLLPLAKAGNKLGESYTPKMCHTTATAATAADDADAAGDVAAAAATRRVTTACQHLPPDQT